MQGTVLRALAAANPAATAAGATDFEEAEVDSWLDFAANELSAHTAVAAPHALTFGALGRLDGMLASRTFLVGETFPQARSKPVPTRVVETHIGTIKKSVPQIS
jgi:glutathione S-transferase